VTSDDGEEIHGERSPWKGMENVRKRQIEKGELEMVHRLSVFTQPGRGGKGKATRGKGKKSYLMFLKGI